MEESGYDVDVEKAATCVTVMMVQDFDKDGKPLLCKKEKDKNI